jgi:hypothetical protein
MLKQCIFASLLMLGSQAQAETTLSKPMKTYIEKDAVRILKNGFAIITEKGTFVAKSLRSDKNGLYVLSKDIYPEKIRSKRRHSTRSRTYWARCPVCHKWCRNQRAMMNHTCKSEETSSSRPGSDSNDW